VLPGPLQKIMMTPIAAVDIGSLTVRLAVAEAAAPGTFQVVQHRREITGLGREVDASGALSPADQDLTLKALEGFAREMAAQGVASGQAVATQAVRQAQNGREFLDAAAKVLNLPVRLLSPEEEARLTLAGVLSALDPKYVEAGPVLVFDLGGGSLEFILLRPGQELVLAGLPLGVLSVSRTRPLGDPPQPFRVDDLKRELRRAVQDFYQRRFRTFVETPPVLVGTAGTVTTLAAMALEMDEYDPQRVNNYILPRELVGDMAEVLSLLPEKKRALIPGLEPAKAGVMVAGAFIVQAILAVLGRDHLVCVDAGLLEGVLAELARGPENKS
jgi:exopolyphosphatase / guanosine-5'-triphosphate,3'-diphosphate pyrophosphatase